MIKISELNEIVWYVEDLRFEKGGTESEGFEKDCADVATLWEIFKY